MALHILSVDLQNAFAAPGGGLYRPRPCVPFICDTLIPFVREHGQIITEIVSDYRSADPGASSCVPGRWDYDSLIPADVKDPNVWVKAMPSPSWVREGGGQADKEPGVPYPEPDAFSAWLETTLGPPTPDQTVVLIGLMLEICVLSTLQELKYRGYRVEVLSEGVDTYAGTAAQKEHLFEAFFPFWGEGVTWKGLKGRLERA
jgi:nicotinamidase-related amidase